MNKLIMFRNTCLMWMIALMAVATTACKEDNTDSNLQIHYPEVVNIGPSMSFSSSTPTFYGPVPSNFSIAGITLDDQAITCDSFSIKAQNGIVSIVNTDALATGTYKLTIACQGSDGASHTFRDVFVVKMVSATPTEIEVSAPELVIPYEELTDDKSSVQVTPIGESVSVTAYTLVQAEGQEYFAISKEGLVTLNAAFKGERLPGIYPLPIRITTHAGVRTYENLLTAKITSLPLSVSYAAMGRLEYNMAFTSVTPTMKGSPEELFWAIKTVTPATDKFAIDPVTGVISAAEGNALPVDEVYTFDLTLTNAYGSADFDATYQVTVIAYIAPIDPATFAYEPAEAIQGSEFSASKKSGFVGDEVQFTLGTLPAALVGQVSIDSATGTVSAQKGNTIPSGVYTVPVKATNTKSEVEVNLTLTIQDNPYYFTKIVYGNNLGLTPAENYANQFHCKSLEELKTLNLQPTTDAKSGVEIEWSIKLKHQMTDAKGATTKIDETTGVITSDAFNNVDGGNGGLVYVTATAGKGKVGETSVTVPVFFSFSGTNNGVTIRYKPFVFQVNPRKGGTSIIPEVTGVADMSKFLLDYRRTFNYYNINGPASHADGIPSASSFLGALWKNFYISIGTPNKLNYGSKDPMSYYSNKARLSSALVYVDPETKAVVVNANKWIDENGAANGAFFAQMTFVTDGNEGGVNNGTKYFPLWIWFDEKF